jgi:hypothetical protein
MSDKTHALVSLRPGAQWVLRGDDLEWMDTEQTQPTDAEIDAEVARLQAEYEAKEYQRKRAAEYPPVADYLDGVVKGDQAQVDAYVAACLAVKAKYPKEPENV